MSDPAKQLQDHGTCLISGIRFEVRAIKPGVWQLCAPGTAHDFEHDQALDRLSDAIVTLTNLRGLMRAGNAAPSEIGEQAELTAFTLVQALTLAHELMRKGHREDSRRTSPSPGLLAALTSMASKHPTNG